MTNDYREFVEDYFADQEVEEDDAWQHVYKILWDKYDTVEHETTKRSEEVENIPTIKESSTIESFKWMDRGVRARNYIQDAIGDAYDDDFDLLYSGLGGDRQNTRGNGFEHTTSYLIETFCGVEPMVGPQLSGGTNAPMRGYEMIQEGDVETLDLALFSPGEFRMVISTKWTLRRDRLKQYLFEAEFLKERTPDLNMTVLTNDCDENYLTTLIDHHAIDRVYHVHKPLVLETIRPFDEESGSLLELVEDASPTDITKAYRYFKLHEEMKDFTNLIDDINNMIESRQTSDDGP
ncbi:hypothetical protein ACFQMM_02410 [Saliphagus sp. GCM10025308]